MTVDNEQLTINEPETTVTPEPPVTTTTPPITTTTPPTTTTPKATTPPPEEPAPDEPFNGIKCVEEFVRLDAGWFVGGVFPHFEDINAVPLVTILSFCARKMDIPYNYCDEEQLDRVFGVFKNSLGGSTFAFTPWIVESHIKEYLNPDFLFEIYKGLGFNDNTPVANFELFWDYEAEQLIMFSGIFGGGPGYFNEVLKVYEEDDFHYVITKNFWCMHDYCGLCDFDYLLENKPEEIKHSIYTFTINENGNVNIISKLPYEGELP